MSLSDVETFFHEFGHLVHWILAGKQQWAGIGGLTLEADFWSQFDPGDPLEGDAPASALAKPR